MISIIAPTFNEAENIGILAERVHKALEGTNYELIVVDDNSKDGTSRKAKKLSKKFSVRVLDRKGKRSYTKSVLLGIRASRGKTICVADADLSHHPEFIPSMINEMKKRNADIVVGSRHAKGGKIKGWPLSRRVMSGFGRMIAYPLAQINDSMSGFFVLKKDVIKKAKLKPRSCKILLEILAKGKYNQVFEYPITFTGRINGKSKMNVVEMIRYLTHVTMLYAHKIRKKT